MNAVPKAMAGFTTQCCAQVTMREVLMPVKGTVGVLWCANMAADGTSKAPQVGAKAVHAHNTLVFTPKSDICWIGSMKRWLPIEPTISTPGNLVSTSLTKINKRQLRNKMNVNFYLILNPCSLPLWTSANSIKGSLGYIAYFV